MGRLVVRQQRLAWVAAAAALVWFAVQAPRAAQVQLPAQGATAAPAGATFVEARECMACHNGLVTSGGEDVSVGLAWRASMMANSARDPYWQAGVRREVMDHPESQQAIEDECSICHMPMARTLAHEQGRETEVFAQLPWRQSGTHEERLAAEGVSCTLCHQISPERLGTRESFTGGFVIAPPEAGGPRMFGPFEVDEGRAAVMRSATGVRPAEATHIEQSEVCATCHTLVTQALGPKGEVLGSLPEQVPYQEWLHSAYVKEQSCQSCHMPRVADTRIASVVGDTREHLGRHTFLGGNFFMLRMLNRFRTELAVDALPHELDAAAAGTLRQLRMDTASLTIASAQLQGGTLRVEVAVRNLTGHKLPTAYPSRRAWLHLQVRDRNGRIVFESGAVEPTGRIRGNDNDADASRYEPHYEVIRSADEVQIYESIMGTPAGTVTTGLLQATQYLKDNRLLPRGFDKATASDDVLVMGGARMDADFVGGGDQVRYEIAVGNAEGPFEIDVTLRYQPIGFRWADNLRAYATAEEPRRFLSFWDSMAQGSSAELAHATASAR